MEYKLKPTLAKDALTLMGSKLINYMIMLASMMILTRISSLTEYGTYSQLLILVRLGGTVMMLGLPACLSYFLANYTEPTKRRRFLSAFFTLNTILGLLTGAVLVVCLPLAEAYFHNAYLRAFALFLAVYPWAMLTNSTIENLLISLGKSRAIIPFKTAHNAAILLSLLLFTQLPWSFARYMTVYLIVEIVFALITYLLGGRAVGGLRPCLDRELIKAILLFSVPLGLASAVATLQAETDKLLIGYFYTSEQLALYASAAQELPVSIISTALVTVLLPRVARKLHDGAAGDAVALWKDATVIGLIANTFFAAGLCVFAREAVVLLYSEKYAASAPIFAIYSLALVVRSTYFGMILNCSGNTEYILKNAVMNLALNAVLNIALYYLIGFSGPAIATVLVTVYGARYLLVKTSEFTNVPIRQLYPWKWLGITLGAQLALSGVFFGLKLLLPLERYLTAPGEAIALALVWMLVTFLVFRRQLKEKWAVLKEN